jgi:hypothetical protein
MSDAIFMGWSSNLKWNLNRILNSPATTLEEHAPSPGGIPALDGSRRAEDAGKQPRRRRRISIWIAASKAGE